MTGRVQGKVAFITGAARGQGRTHALRLAEEGADIIAIDIAAPVEGVMYPASTNEDLKETVRQVEALGRRIVSDVADVRDLDSLKTIVDRGVSELGHLDIIVANAGVAIMKPWNEVTPEILRTVIDVNLIGAWNSVMAGVEHLISGGGGSVILTSSSNGLKAGPFNLPYNASKFGVTGLMRSFAMELAKQKVRVNSVHPGAVQTMMVSQAAEMFERFNEVNPDLVGMFSQWIPGRMPPEEISNAVLYLASDESTWVTGTALSVDGGLANY
ncbi:SDR family mycofactocin-dependent oxidoreductase [Rhodococcus sp. ACS1]|uniref:mycofactocin-coupled SDR family oxidoreductase n=1 Tax=Rhodococcus sp. ACS1 TaxID=2028570 RepID=UPI000AAAB706|nr:mycofactocin-coupled SDR family oxidoreductase [Rhodococcus sp. ACS1]PBC39312.1 SDR family mycofactocin-dependent oxidoreductase [Rhodococcus sp. ACS1]TQC48665.1 NAD(P)-dependent oxidoreductase [Rhodococcus sp. WS4]